VDIRLCLSKAGVEVHYYFGNRFRARSLSTRIIRSGSGGSEAVSLAARNGFAYCVDAPFRDLFAKFASFSMHVRLAESKKSIAPPLESTGSIGSPYANLSAKWPMNSGHIGVLWRIRFP
jgi:hypothetical protein